MIISASRRTDIPAFFGEWVINRLKAGYVMVRNPFNYSCVYRIELSPKTVDCIVFWTKNPIPFIHRLHDITCPFYFLFTITGYGNELETNLPERETIIKSFIRLSGTIGKERVIWRYDPILLTSSIDISWHYRNFTDLAKRLGKYTNTCIFSFIYMYQKCIKNLKGKEARSIAQDDQMMLAGRLSQIAKSYGIALYTCATEAHLTSVGIEHGSCVNKILIEQIIGSKLNIKKDKHQRDHCQCYESIDIGAYNTCMHNCLYCYANSNSESVKKNFALHNPGSPLLFGEVKKDDNVTVRHIKSNKIYHPLF